MSRTPIEAVSHKTPRQTTLGSAVRTLALAGATLTTGLIAGVFGRVCPNLPALRSSVLARPKSCERPRYSPRGARGGGA